MTRREPFRSRASSSSRSRALPTKEEAGRGRFVFEIVFSGGKRSLPSWKSATGSSKSFRRCSPSSVRSPSTSARVAARHDDLAAVARSGDPRGPVELAPGVALAGQLQLARVQAHPHLDRARRERLLTLRRSSQRLDRIGEGIQKRVPLCVDLDAAVSGEGGAQEPAVLRERVDVARPRPAPRSAASSPRCP